MGKSPQITISRGPDVAATRALEPGSIAAFEFNYGDGRPAQLVEAEVLEIRHVIDGIYFIYLELNALRFTVSYAPKPGIGALLSGR